LVRDPLTFDHFLVTPTERSIAVLVEECGSVDELLEEYHRRHPFQRMSAQNCVRFIHRLCSLGIVLDDRRGQALQQRRKKRAQQKKSRILQLLSPLYVRLPGIDASWLLKRLDGVSRFLFHPVAIGAVLASFVMLLGFVISHLDSIAGKVLENASFLTAQDALLLLAVFVVVKVFHELGHALACRFYRADCHEIGILFLVLAPCLYCDVTDAWRLKSRWQRMFIAAAGMYVELIISILAMILWLNTVPSAVNTLAFNTLAVCSIGTIFVNINPLIRYDGYYMLTDLTDIPNLSSQGNEVLDRRIVQWFAYRDVAPSQQDGSDTFLLSYSLAALSYRVFMVTAICWMLLHFGRAHHVEPLAWGVIAVMLFGVTYKVSQTMRNLFRRVKLGGVHPLRTTATAAILIAGFAALWLPTSSDFPIVGVLDSADNAPIYATQDGTLVPALPSGTQVEEGTTIATIENFELDLQEKGLENKINANRIRERHLIDRSTIDEAAARELPELRTRLSQLEDQLATVRDEIDSLVIKSPCDGWIVAVPWRSEVEKHDRRLPRWSGDPLAAENQGYLVERGELLCRVVTNKNWEAVFYVPDKTVDLVVSQANTKICLAAAPGIIYTGKVGLIGREAVDEVPMSLADRIPYASVDGRPQPLEPHYRVAVRLSAKLNHAAFDGVVHGRVEMEPTSIASRLSRYATRIWRTDIQ
jgi:putative peptide zinc metalloprotease protein